MAACLPALLAAGLLVSRAWGSWPAILREPPALDLVSFFLTVLPAVLYFTILEGGPAPALGSLFVAPALARKDRRTLYDQAPGTIVTAGGAAAGPPRSGRGGPKGAAITA